ncbi:MAG: hypothetical protein HY918_02780 [Candidatus Doudnabacteria bacterium]|nr:hypothetical protein [Candidatus Doudnabacteria bacterium]
MKKIKGQHKAHKKELPTSPHHLPFLSLIVITLVFLVALGWTVGLEVSSYVWLILTVVFVTYTQYYKIQLGEILDWWKSIPDPIHASIFILLSATLIIFSFLLLHDNVPRLEWVKKRPIK